MSNDRKFSEAPIKPGDNPNKLNAKRRAIRPKTQNAPAGSNSQMRLNWIDPLPNVDAITPLGLEPNVEAVPAGEIELDFNLPTAISTPFAETVEATADRLYLDNDQKEEMKVNLLAQAHFKAARQLYSTLQDYEKVACQPLKAVFYDESHIPLHMAGALGIIGHVETKVGLVVIRDAPVLFRRWITKGLQAANLVDQNVDASRTVWSDRASFQAVQRLARETISELVKQTYVLSVGATDYTVSMPQLDESNLQRYFDQINQNVPDGEKLRDCVRVLQATIKQWNTDEGIPNDGSRNDILTSLDLVWGDNFAPDQLLREQFEEFSANYVTRVGPRISSVFKTGPSPAGSHGYGAQIVSSFQNKANWNMPLSDADVNVGFLFSPNRSFTLNPRLVGYSTRKKETAAAAFAAQDNRAPV